MAVNSTQFLKVGDRAPSFSLTDVGSGQPLSLEDIIEGFSKGVAIIFLCRHCPYVKHLQQSLIAAAEAFMKQGIAFIGISANDPINYPEDAPENLKKMVEEDGVPFPILFDETQEVAKSFGAVCTPEFFLFNIHQELFYHGRFDGSTPGNGVPVTGEDFRSALTALCLGEKAKEPFPPALGCSIKWKS